MLEKIKKESLYFIAFITIVASTSVVLLSPLLFIPEEAQNKNVSEEINEPSIENEVIDTDIDTAGLTPEVIKIKREIVYVPIEKETKEEVSIPEVVTIDNTIIIPSVPTTTPEIVEQIVEQKIIYVPVEPVIVEVSTPQVQTPGIPVEQPILLVEEINMSSLEIISPMANKGLGRKYKASEITEDESNYIEIGLVIRDDDGKSTNLDKVIVTATDESQNKEINTTGNVTKVWIEQSQKTVYYYPFSYNFYTPGTHTITFESNGMTKSVELIVE